MGSVDAHLSMGSSQGDTQLGGGVRKHPHDEPTTLLQSVLLWVMYAGVVWLLIQLYR